MRPLFPSMFYVEVLTNFEIYVILRNEVSDMTFT